MKNVLVVVEALQSDSALIQKALRFKPQKLCLLQLKGEKNAADISAATVNNLLKQEGLSDTKVEIKSAVVRTAMAIEQAIEDRARKSRAALVVLRKPNMVDEAHRLDFIKKLLRAPLQAELLFCLGKKWKAQPALMCSLDMNARNQQQQNLNEQVYQYTQATLVPALDAKLHVATVINISAVNDELDITSAEEVLVKKGKAFEKKLADFVEEHASAKHEVVGKLHVGAGRPGKQLPSMVKKQKVDLLVMGNVGRKGLKGVVLGNTAEKIIKKLSSDVLIVKSDLD